MSYAQTGGRILLAALGILSWQSGCRRAPQDGPGPSSGQLPPASQNQGPIPRTKAEIIEAQKTLPALYLVPDTGRTVTAPDGARAVFDLETQSLAYRVWVCTNPQCPGRKPGGEPVQFIWKDWRLYARPDGTVDFKTVDDRNPEVKRRARPNIPECPECLKIRNPDSESEEVRQQYVGYCVEYALPDSERRRHELEEEYARLLAQEQAQREGGR